MVRAFQGSPSGLPSCFGPRLARERARRVRHSADDAGQRTVSKRRKPSRRASRARHGESSSGEERPAPLAPPGDLRHRPLAGLADVVRRAPAEEPTAGKARASASKGPARRARPAPDATRREPEPAPASDEGSAADFDELMRQSDVERLGASGPERVIRREESEGPLRSRPAPPPRAMPLEETDEVLDPELAELVGHLRATSRRPDAERRRQLRDMPVLDLHGYRVADVRDELRRFLQSCVIGGARWARVVTGRGRHSAGNAGVRDEAETLLADSPLVASYERGGPAEGGAGVLLVHLRRAPGGRP